MSRMCCRKLVILTAALGCLLILTACGVEKINKANFDKIQINMTEAEVEAILGPPTEATGIDVAGFSGTTSTWKQKDVVITVQFVNGRVAAKHFAKPPVSGR